MTSPEDVAIAHEPPDDAGRGRYVMRFADGAEAELVYRRLEGGVLSADHTFTPPAKRGHGIAARLVERLVADARAAGVKIRPVCPFVARWFDRHPDAADLRAG